MEEAANPHSVTNPSRERVCHHPNSSSGTRQPACESWLCHLIIMWYFFWKEGAKNQKTDADIRNIEGLGSVALIALAPGYLRCVTMSPAALTVSCWGTKTLRKACQGHSVKCQNKCFSLIVCSCVEFNIALLGRLPISYQHNRNPVVLAKVIFVPYAHP